MPLNYDIGKKKESGNENQTVLNYAVKGKPVKNPGDVTGINPEKTKSLLTPGYWNQGQVGMKTTGENQVLNNKTGNDVDFSFVNQNEGGRKLEGYIPIKGKSGVTISTGIDLGQYSGDEVKRVLGHDNLSIYEKYKPYIGLKGDQAYNMLNKSPLVVTEKEAETTEKLFHDYRLKLTKNAFEDKTSIKFDSLPQEAKTVVYDLSYHNGQNNIPLDVLKYIAAGNYEDAAKYLESSSTYTGRNKERAALLRLINKGDIK